MNNKKEGVSSPAPLAIMPKQTASSSTVVSSSISSSSSKNPVPTSDDKAAAKPSTVTTADMMDVDAATQQPAKMDISKAPTIDDTIDDGAEKIVVAASAHTKKKKKKSYKSLVAGMMEGNKDRVKSEEKDNIKKVTGGGAFVKIDKI